LNVLLVKITAEKKDKKEDPKIVNVDFSVRKLVNCSKDFYQGIIIEAHEFLLQGLYRLNTGNLFLKHPDDTKLNVMR